MAANEYLELADWRRQVAAMWERWRADAAHDPAAATEVFRAAKRRLFREHPQSPVPAHRRTGYTGPEHWPYDPVWRMTVTLEPATADPTGPHEAPADPGTGGIALPSSGAGGISFRRVGSVALSGPLEGRSLSVFWIEGYGGGLFLPLRDGTSGEETYGAGRYLLDSMKSADHGGDPEGGTLLLDFNMAYHPSCAYDPRWSCPLAPPENRLDAPVRVGERL